MKKPHLILAALLLLLLSSCSEKDQEYRKDAPRGAYDYSKADVMAYPDGYSNVAAKCDGPNRVYVIFHNDSKYGSVAVVPNDPRCTKTETGQ